MKSPHHSAPEPTTPRQSTPDERIDLVLAALNRTPAPDALEERVLRRLSARSPALPRSRFALFAATPLAWASAVCAVAALLAALLLTRPPTQPSGIEAHAPAPRNVRPQPAPPGLSALNRPSAPALRTGPPAVRLSSHSFVANTSAATATAPVGAPSGAPSAETATLTGHAPADPSLDGPAPELPLTEQERLLLRIAYGPQPQQLASLKRFTVHLRPDDTEPDFNKFFEPYTLPLTEGDPQ